MDATCGLTRCHRHHRPAAVCQPHTCNAYNDEGQEKSGKYPPCLPGEKWRWVAEGLRVNMIGVTQRRSQRTDQCQIYETGNF